MHAQDMYDEEKVKALEALLNALGDKMSEGGQEESKEGDTAFGGNESPMEEMLESAMGSKDSMDNKDDGMETTDPMEMRKKGELDPEEMSSFMKNKGFKKPMGVSAKLMMITAKPRSKMKMKG